MRRNVMIIYSILILFFIGMLGVSYQYYTKVNEYENRIQQVMAVEEETPDYYFALITEEMDHEYWHLVEEGVKEAEKKYDVHVEYIGTRRSNHDEQVELMDMAIAGKVDGIIVQAVRDEMFTPVINKAVEKEIPVVTIDTDAPDSMRSTYVGTDNYQAGEIAGRAMIQDTGGNAIVGIITNSLTSTHQQLRVQGFMDVIEEEEGMEVVAVEASNNTRIEAERKADLILSEYENVNAFYGTSALDGIGISASVEASNRREEIYILAFDTLNETLALLEQGKVDGIISQQPYQMGFQSVELMLNVLHGEPVEEMNNTYTDVIRQVDVEHYYRRSGETR